MNDQTDDLIKLSFFANIGKAIAATQTLKETLNEVMTQIGDILAPAYWSLLLRNPKTGELTFTTVIGSGVDALKGKVLPKGTGVAGWIAESGNPVILEDVTKDSRFDPTMDQLLNFKTKSIIGVPLISKGRVFGVIELINKLDGSPFTPLELKLLTTIADFAAIAIEKAYYYRALQKVASIDPLTGIYNRRSFNRFMEKEIERSKRFSNYFCLMMIDIDNFKKINDSFGHVAGDGVLKELAELLVNSVRKSDLVCRYGGDEFVVIMPGIRLQKAKSVKKRIQKNIQSRNRKDLINLHLSIGLFETDGSDTDNIIEFVDEDLYEHKFEKLEGSIGDVEKNIEEMLTE